MIDQPARNGGQNHQRASRHPEYARHPTHGPLLLPDLLGQCFDGRLQATGGLGQMNDRLQGKAVVGSRPGRGVFRRTAWVRDARFPSGIGMQISYRDSPTVCG